ncbi:hypothetical protein DKX38_025013 [Salix brachista]|uniref:Uncharacterized protein n=1 Tax=Salix brachista TaxID=2182728 RepID=A0A5N5JRR3_9ROSI|nr:hypothetical protein DKX38_025013 [Salix brachista]
MPALLIVEGKLVYTVQCNSRYRTSSWIICCLLTRFHFAINHLILTFAIWKTGDLVKTDGSISEKRTKVKNDPEFHGGQVAVDLHDASVLQPKEHKRSGTANAFPSI